MPGESSAARYLPSFNGWRGVCIILVLGLHLEYAAGIPAGCAYWARKLFDGLLGVRFFFTISGFLITWLMLREEKELGYMSLKNFYIRRALRILPVYFAYLGVLALFQLAGSVAQTPFVWLELLTFTRNFYQTGHMICPTSLHFWSLAVEEQFYLVWPLTFVCLARWPARRISFLLFAILFSWGWKVISFLGCYNRHVFFLFQEYSTFAYVDALAYGCLGAILLASRPADLQKFFDRIQTPVFIGALLLIGVPKIADVGTGLQSLGFAMLLLHSVVAPGFGPYRLLHQPWLVKIGVLSYSLYIWQEIVYLQWPWPKLWYLSVLGVFVAGWLSYNCLEKPLFSLRAKLRNHVDTEKIDQTARRQAHRLSPGSSPD